MTGLQSYCSVMNINSDTSPTPWWQISGAKEGKLEVNSRPVMLRFYHAHSRKETSTQGQWCKGAITQSCTLKEEKRQLEASDVKLLSRAFKEEKRLSEANPLLSEKLQYEWKYKIQQTAIIRGGFNGWVICIIGEVKLNTCNNSEVHDASEMTKAMVCLSQLMQRGPPMSRDFRLKPRQKVITSVLTKCALADTCLSKLYYWKSKFIKSNRCRWLFVAFKLTSASRVLHYSMINMHFPSLKKIIAFLPNICSSTPYFFFLNVWKFNLVWVQLFLKVI